MYFLLYINITNNNSFFLTYVNLIDKLIKYKKYYEQFASDDNNLKKLNSNLILEKLFLLNKFNFLYIMSECLNLILIIQKLRWIDKRYYTIENYKKFICF